MSNELSNPVQELIDRLNYQAATGRILEGWRVLDIPVAEVQGMKDFPCAVVFLPTFTEAYKPGGRGGWALASMALNVLVSTKRELGIPNLIQSVAKVLNALETRAATPAVIDPNLGGTTKPFSVTVSNNFVLDLSVNAQITVTIEPRPYLRGAR